MKFVFCCLGSKLGEFNFEFFFPKINNIFDIVTRLGLLRAALEENALNRGFIKKKFKIIKPFYCLVDNSLFSKF
jgi:hypothetical protein